MKWRLDPVQQRRLISAVQVENIRFLLPMQNLPVAKSAFSQHHFSHDDSNNLKKQQQLLRVDSVTRPSAYNSTTKSFNIKHTLSSRCNNEF